MNQLVSYPRSGNTWYRYCLEYVFCRPTLGCKGSKEDTPIYTRTVHIQNLKNEAPLLRKMHWAHEINQNAPAIFLFRDPYEAILSHLKHGSKRPLRQMVIDYMNIWKAYDRHPQDKKQLVLYEEITMPEPLEGFIRETGILLKIEPKEKNLRQLIRSLDMHKNAALSTYKQKSFTKGLLSKKHMDSAKPHEKKTIAEMINMFPDLKIYLECFYE